MGSMMFGQMAPGISVLGVARGAAVEVFEVLDRVPPIDSSSQSGLKPERVEGHVVFDSVGFRYVSVAVAVVAPERCILMPNRFVLHSCLSKKHV